MKTRTETVSAHVRVLYIWASHAKKESRKIRKDAGVYAYCTTAVLYADAHVVSLGCDVCVPGMIETFYPVYCIHLRVPSQTVLSRRDDTTRPVTSQ